jgi:LacI family transcriptional regulator
LKASEFVKRVTLEDVAEDAGVSRATASLVVRGSSLVADATRARVLASIDRLGYVYNRAAAALRTQRSQTVGVVVTDIANPFFAQMTLGCERHVDADAYVLLLANTSDDAARQARLLKAMVARGVDGVLLCPARGTDPEELARLRRWSMPFVLVARYVRGVEADYVGVDNVVGAERAVAHLVARGHRRIAFIGGPVESSARQDRLLGYRRALERHALSFVPALVPPTPATRSAGYEAIQALARRPETPTAALCYNDVVAFGVMLGLQAAGLTPGRDFGVVGFDDVEEAALWRPALTTVAVAPNRIGEEAARLLMARIDEPDRPPQSVILQPELIIRAS